MGCGLGLARLSHPIPHSHRALARIGWFLLSETGWIPIGGWMGKHKLARSRGARQASKQRRRALHVDLLLPLGSRDVSIRCGTGGAAGRPPASPASDHFDRRGSGLCGCRACARCWDSWLDSPRARGRLLYTAGQSLRPCGCRRRTSSSRMDAVRAPDRKLPRLLA